MNKVYCKNCIYALYGNEGSFCGAKNQWKGNEFTNEKDMPFYRKELNINGNCEYYKKKKWWQIKI